jgi:hypothetical protein
MPWNWIGWVKGAKKLFFSPVSSAFAIPSTHKSVRQQQACYGSKTRAQGLMGERMALHAEKKRRKVSVACCCWMPNFAGCCCRRRRGGGCGGGRRESAPGEFAATPAYFRWGQPEMPTPLQEAKLPGLFSCCWFFFLGHRFFLALSFLLAFLCRHCQQPADRGRNGTGRFIFCGRNFALFFSDVFRMEKKK